MLALLDSSLAAPALVAAESASPGIALWSVDAVSVLLLILVGGIAAAVLPFAHRSLRGDRHGFGITLGIGAMLVATAVLAVSGPLWMIGLAWSAATAATLITLGLGGGPRALLPGAAWLIAADVALWAAIALLSWGATADAPALLLVAAAALRCALPPAHGWLLGSLYAPTPVSAALHGGIVNGGGILVITQLSTIGQSALAVGALAIVAGAAIVVGVLASLVRTDIKGKLVMSTVAQMGFMLLCAALGLTAAALLHLVAHGFYKSSLFLASSDGIDRRAHDRRAPLPLALSARSRAVRALAGAAAPAAVLAVVAVAVYPGGRGIPELVVLLAVGAAFAAAGTRAALLAPDSALVAASVALLSGAAALYALATSAVTALIPPSGSPTGAETGVVVVALVLLALIVVSAVRHGSPTSGLALSLLAAGHRVGATPAWPGRQRAAAAPAAAPYASRHHPQPMGVSS